MQRGRKTNKGFTLVELIVVITILAILGTIGFLSFQVYSKNSRDSVRISDIKNITIGLEMTLAKGKLLYIPENKIDIKADGNVISYQGYMGEKIMNKIGLHGGGRDPLDNTLYTYTTNKILTKYQILGFLENSNNISLLQNSYASRTLENSYPYTKGSELGIILQTGSLEPAQIANTDIDIVNTNTKYSVYLDNKENITGTGTNIKKIKSLVLYGSATNCKELLNKNKKLKNHDGIYTINPTGLLSLEVECDMSLNEGGRTYCGLEHSDCNFNGTFEVRYGVYPNYYFKTISNGTNCSNSVFGDPYIGHFKNCYYK